MLVPEIDSTDSGIGVALQKPLANLWSSNTNERVGSV